MNVLSWLVPLALLMGVAGLVAFLWSLRNGQYDDMSGAAERILLAQDEDRPITSTNRDVPSGCVTKGDKAG